MRDAVASIDMSDQARASLYAVLDDMPEELLVHTISIPWNDPLEQRLQRDPQLRAGVDDVRRRLSSPHE
jgi:hypothetical protein